MSGPGFCWLFLMSWIVVFMGLECNFTEWSGNMTVVRYRYTVRAYSADGFKPHPDTGWCVWDNETGAEAEANEMRYVNLRYDEAVEGAEELNNPE